MPPGFPVPSFTHGTCGEGYAAGHHRFVTNCFNGGLHLTVCVAGGEKQIPPFGRNDKNERNELDEKNTLDEKNELDESFAGGLAGSLWR
jgi:hypothetical protein